MEAGLLDKYNARLVAGGDRVSMRNVQRIAFLIIGAVGTTGVTLTQHNADTGGITKALAVGNPYYFKADGATKYTRTTVDTPDDSYTLAVGADGLAVFEVLAEDLDRDGGFTHVSATADGGGTVVALAQGFKSPAYDLDI